MTAPLAQMWEAPCLVRGRRLESVMIRRSTAKKRLRDECAKYLLKASNARTPWRRQLWCFVADTCSDDTRRANLAVEQWEAFAAPLRHARWMHQQTRHALKEREEADRFHVEGACGFRWESDTGTHTCSLARRHEDDEHTCLCGAAP